MGWQQSPPYFCSFTETCADLANTQLASNPTHPYAYVLDAQHHPSQLAEDYAPTAAWPHIQQLPPTPLQLVDVYLDDFIVMAQKPTHIAAMNNLLHHIDSVFRDTPESVRRPLISQSKVAKGDATFSHQKIVLGWAVDTQRMEVSLPDHRVHRITDLLTSTLKKRYCSRRQWQRLLGELRSMATAIHSAKYLFSLLQHQLISASSRRFRLTALTRQALTDWVHLARTLHSTPVPIRSLVPHAPHYWAATDASIQGMGGFWVPAITAPDGQPCIWRHPYPSSWAKRLLSTNNTQGDLTNSDLELAALLTGHATRATHTPHVPHLSTYTATDNTPTQGWVAKGSATTDKNPAFLLRLLAHLCRETLSTIHPVFTPGASNTLADFLSRSFHLSDMELLSHVQQHYPVQPPWRLVTPPNNTISNLNWALSKQLPPAARHEEGLVPKPQAGESGTLSAETWPVTLSLPTSRTRFHCSKYSLPDTAWERWLPPGLKSKLERWKMPYVPWARPWPHWGIPTHDCNTPGGWTFDYNANYKDITSKIHHRSG